MQRIKRTLDVNGNTRPMAGGWLFATGIAVAAALVAAGIVQAGTPDKDAERPNDDLAQVLQDALEAGDLTVEEAREAYFEDVYPGSATHAKIEGELERITAKIEAIIEAGEISEEDAKAKRAWVREERERNEGLAFAVEVRGLSPSEAYRPRQSCTTSAMPREVNSAPEKPTRL